MIGGDGFLVLAQVSSILGDMDGITIPLQGQVTRDDLALPFIVLFSIILAISTIFLTKNYNYNVNYHKYVLEEDVNKAKVFAHSILIPFIVGVGGSAVSIIVLFHSFPAYPLAHKENITQACDDKGYSCSVDKDSFRVNKDEEWKNITIKKNNKDYHVDTIDTSATNNVKISITPK